MNFCSMKYFLPFLFSFNVHFSPLHKHKRSFCGLLAAVLSHVSKTYFLDSCRKQLESVVSCITSCFTFRPSLHKVCNCAILCNVLPIRKACKLHNMAGIHQFSIKSNDLHSFQSWLSKSVQKIAWHQSIINALTRQHDGNFDKLRWDDRAEDEVYKYLVKSCKVL